MAAFGDGFTALWHSVKSLFGSAEADLDGLGHFLDALFLPYALGGAILGLIAAFVTYWVRPAGDRLSGAPPAPVRPAGRRARKRRGARAGGLCHP